MVEYINYITVLYLKWKTHAFDDHPLEVYSL